MALGHEKLGVYRLAAMLSRLGKRGYSVQEESAGYGVDSYWGAQVLLNQAPLG